MATVPAFSQVLWELAPGWSPPGPVLSPPVPTGFVWVVRSLSALHSGSSAGTAIAQLYFLVDGFAAWSTPSCRSSPGIVYSAEDVRWVVPATSFLSVESNDGLWRVRVSGYQLTA